MREAETLEAISLHLGRSSSVQRWQAADDLSWLANLSKATRSFLLLRRNISGSTGAVSTSLEGNLSLVMLPDRGVFEFSLSI